MKIENKEHLIHLSNNVNQQKELLDEQDMTNVLIWKIMNFSKKNLTNLFN